MTTAHVRSVEAGYAPKGVPMAQKSGTKRVHLTLPIALHEKMKEIQAETNSTTLVEVVKDALVTYLALVKEHKKGKQIIVRDGDNGKETIYAVFI